MIEQLAQRNNLNLSEIMQNLDKDMGMRLRKLRKARGLTQEQLAEELGLSLKHISSVERGTSSFSLENLILASVYFDCTLDYLILGKNSTDSMSKMPASVLSLFSSDNEEEKDLFVEYMKLFVNFRKQ